jgi:hypothetical protein
MSSLMARLLLHPQCLGQLIYLYSLIYVQASSGVVGLASPLTSRYIGDDLDPLPSNNFFIVDTKLPFSI